MSKVYMLTLLGKYIFLKPNYIGLSETGRIYDMKDLARKRPRTRVIRLLDTSVSTPLSVKSNTTISGQLFRFRSTA